MRFVWMVTIGVSLVFAQEISSGRIRAHIKFLASDLLEGRGVGARGGDLAAEYIASQLAVAGAKPAGADGSYFQPVPLVGVQTDSSSSLTASAAGKNIGFRWLDDFVGHTDTQLPRKEFDADAIFVGHGITAPEFGWDDYREIDVAGKVVVLFTNEPPSSDAAFFEGPALTYYGRWTYKYEQAMRKGAAACLIVHTTPTAGYGWDVVRNSWGHEDFQVKVSGPALGFAGWLTQEAGAKLLAMAGHDVDDLLKKANTRGFRAMPLGIRIKGSIGSKTRELLTRNVAGFIPGSDPAVSDEAVIFSGHWDHLGRNEKAAGDGIYNGAVDDATGVAIILEIARAWADLPVKPRRGALFLALTAEESGLLGSAYYAQHPLVPIAKTALDINYDPIYPYGRTKDVVLEGAQRTTFWPQIQNMAERFQLTLGLDPQPEQGHYFRSDHFSFAKAGIPAFTVNQGEQYLANAEEARAKRREYDEKRYHQPSDEYDDSWDLSNMEYLARFGMVIGQDAANAPALVRWTKDLPKQASAADPLRPKKRRR